MIALQSLKYKFLEWCIDTFTDGIVNNFRIIPNSNGIVNVRDLRKNMRLSKINTIIKHTDGSFDLYCWINCIIYHIEKSEVYHNKKIIGSGYHLDFTYEKAFKNNQAFGEGSSEDDRFQTWVCDLNDPDYEFFI